MNWGLVKDRAALCLLFPLIYPLLAFEACLGFSVDLAEVRGQAAEIWRGDPYRDDDDE
jgi:hypothetical protein